MARRVTVSEAQDQLLETAFDLYRTVYRLHRYREGLRVPERLEDACFDEMEIGSEPPTLEVAVGEDIGLSIDELVEIADRLQGGGRGLPMSLFVVSGAGSGRGRRDEPASSATFRDFGRPIPRPAPGARGGHVHSRLRSSDSATCPRRQRRSMGPIRHATLDCGLVPFKGLTKLTNSGRRSGRDPRTTEVS